MGQEKNKRDPVQLQYTVIDTSGGVEHFVRHTGDISMLAVDLEADSMFHYREKVCLLQIAANGHTVVIDPLRAPDLTPLRPLFAHPGICKVLHGADYDVRSLYRDFGIVINNLFDTQLASMYLGQKETGLEAVVARHFGVELNKKYQKKDWSQRPLPTEMVSYAALDVAYLIPLADLLIKELRSKGRLEWVQEECRLLSQVRSVENNSGPLYLKFKGAGRLTPRQLAALEALLQLRDALARQKDRPLFKIIGNAALLKIAAAMPTTLKRLQASEALSEKQLNMYGQAVIDTLKQVHRIGRAELPCYPYLRSPRLSPRVPERVNALRTWRDQVARSYDLDPALLLNKALIRDIAVQKPLNEAALAAVPGIHQWQVHAFGRQILAVLGNLA